MSALQRRQTFPCIVRDARRRGAHLVFRDEFGYMLPPTVRGTWAQRGVTRVLSCWDGRNLRSRSTVVRGFLADYPEIVIETLPAYVPELDADELVWG